MFIPLGDKFQTISTSYFCVIDQYNMPHIVFDIGSSYGVLGLAENPARGPAFGLKPPSV